MKEIKKEVPSVRSFGCYDEYLLDDVVGMSTMKYIVVYTSAPKKSL